MRPAGFRNFHARTTGSHVALHTKTGRFIEPLNSSVAQSPQELWCW